MLFTESLQAKSAPTVTRALTSALLLVGVMVATVTTTEAAPPWEKPQQFRSAEHRVWDLDVSIGKRGYGIVGWRSGPFSNARARVALRPPGARRFRKPRSLTPRGGY